MKKIILILMMIVIGGCGFYKYTPDNYASSAATDVTPVTPVHISFADENRTELSRASKENLKEFVVNVGNENINVYSDKGGADTVTDYMARLGHGDVTVLNSYTDNTVVFTDNTYTPPVSDVTPEPVAQQQIAIADEPLPVNTGNDSWLIIIAIILATLGLVSVLWISRRKSAAVIILALVGGGSAGAASVDRDNALETFRSIDSAQRLNEFMDISTISDDETAPTKKSDEVKIVTLHKMVITKSTILSDEFLSDLRKKYIGRKLTATEVSDIARDVNAEYAKLGYPAARAFLPKQDITNGVLHLSLIEGKIDKVKYMGNKWTSQTYLDRFFTIPTGNHVLMSPIERQVLNFNAHNDAKARVALEPGEKYATTDVSVVLDEPNLVSLMAFVDNGGQKETGITRYGFSGGLNGITGYRDVLSVGILGAHGMTSWFTSYEIPDPWISARWGVGYDHSDTQIVAGPLQVLSVKGNYDNMYLYMKKPFLVRNNTVSHINLNLANKRGNSSIQEFLTQTNNTSVATVSLDNTLMFDGITVFNSLSFARGVSMFGADANFTGLSYFGEGQFQILRDMALNIKIRAAYMNASGDGVVPSTEKLQIGGANSVRGYKESLLMTDFGAYGSLELRYNISRYLPDWAKTNAVVFGFFDYGEIFDDNSFINIEQDAPKNLASVGMGLRAGITEYVSGTFTFSQTLITNILWPENDSQFLFFISTRF